ncbi:MAG: hypothetical protein M9921_14720 [Fimbriimonadaceae bacterium]|nr:hypothetical protein [Fimbriimonadaceae bacterium]
MSVNEQFESQENPKTEEARDAANAWIARFAPLVMEDEVLTAPEVRARLATVEALRSDSGEVRRGLQVYGSDADWELSSTLDRAIAQLDSVEEGFRKQLGLLAPGDPEGKANLERLNQRLTERSARQELGLQAEAEMPAVLEEKTSPANWAAAGGIGLFGFGWTSFTTFHAVLMIGGMYSAFGIGALALLGFYAIFFAVGFAMLGAAVNAASDESIELDGRSLTVRRKLGWWVRKKHYSLGPEAKAEIGKVNAVKMGAGNSNSVMPAIVIPDAQGRPVSFGSGKTVEQRKALRDRINAYLAVTRP